MTPDGCERTSERGRSRDLGHPRHPSALTLAIAGSAAVATAFGMARYGYGLLLPDIQDNLGLTATTLGAIGTLAYVAYVITTTLVPRSIARVGQRGTVVSGGLLAVSGTIIIASARGPVLLALGVATAGASAGLIQPPFADAVERLPAAVRARTLTTIACGTGWGVAVAAPVAIAMGDEWRTAFLGFAGCATASTLYAAYALPSRRRVGANPALADSASNVRGSRRVRRGVMPMLAGSALIGLGSAPFWTFAVDAARSAGLDQTAGRALLGVAGLTSVLASGTADVIRRLGATWTFLLGALLEAAAIATVGLAADRIVAVMVAGAAFGAAYTTLTSVTLLWGTRLYPDQPSSGSAAVVRAQATGLLCGPLIGGVVADTIGLTATLLSGAAVVLTAALFAPRRDLIQDAP